MSARRIDRRQALAAWVGIVAAARLAAAPVPKTDPNASWVGKTVMPKRYALATNIELKNPDGPVFGPPATLDAASYEVKDEKGTQVEVLHSTGFTCRVEKADLVLLAEAPEYFTKMLGADGNDRFALVSRGWAFHLLEKPAKAVKDLDEFLRLAPAGMPAPPDTPLRWEGLVNRGLVFAETGGYEKALKDLDEAVKDWPNVGIAWVNRGYTHELMGKYAEALEDYTRGAEAAGAALLAANNRAWLLATCPDQTLRDGKTAVEHARKVCEVTENREGMYLDTLAAAYAEAGRFEDAVKAQEKALGFKGFAARYGEDAQKRLQLYKDKKPFRTEPVKK